MILGIDEVGRGPWAGPLVVGAVVLGGATIDGLTDSKKLSKKRREELDKIIREQAASYGIGWVSAQEIDELGLSEALNVATRRAVEQIETSYHEIIIDGTINFLAGTAKGRYVTTMKKADLLVPSVSAASIIAKVARDNYMTEQDKVYDGYKFASHVGYGTALHRAAIERLGVTPLHRLSFAPLQKYRDQARRPLASSKLPAEVSRSALDTGHVSASTPKNLSGKLKGFWGVTPRAATRASVEPDSRHRPTNYMGAPAETEAANHLVRQGHDIVERNWKTKYCEIDIVSVKGDTVYFTEVKYRKTPWQGDGLAAITPKKLNQMRFAARLYVQVQQLRDTDMQLAAVSMTGDPPEVESFVLIDS